MRVRVLLVLFACFPWLTNGQVKNDALSFPLPTFLNTHQLLAQKPVTFTAEMKRQIERHYRCSPCDSFRGVGVALGGLGQGVLLTDAGDCGGTGNCPISVLFRYGGEYRIADLNSGWTYALVPRKSGIPDIVLMANMSASVGEATRYRFERDTYVQIDSEETPYPP